MAIPGKKRYSGLSVLNYNEIQSPRKRKGIIDFDRLMDLLGLENYYVLKMLTPNGCTAKSELRIVEMKTSGHKA